MSVSSRNLLLLLVCAASIGLGATAVGDDAAPQELNFEYDVICTFSFLSPPSPPPPTSVAAIRDLVGASSSCEGGWVSDGLFADAGLATQQEILLGSRPSNAANRCGVVFARTTLHGSDGDIFIEENTRLICPPEFFGLFQTFESSFNITGGTGDYSNLIGRGKGAGTVDLIFEPLQIQIVVHTHLEGQAKFVNTRRLR